MLKGSEILNKDLLVKINKVVVMLSLFIVGFMALFFKEYKPLVMGYIFGTLINILTLQLMNNTVNKSVLMEPNRAKKYARANYMIRHVIYAAVLVIAALADYLNLLAAVLGLSMVKISILLLGVVDKEFYR